MLPKTAAHPPQPLHYREPEKEQRKERMESGEGVKEGRGREGRKEEKQGKEGPREERRGQRWEERKGGKEEKGAGDKR